MPGVGLGGLKRRMHGRESVKWRKERMLVQPARQSWKGGPVERSGQARSPGVEMAPKSV